MQATNKMQQIPFIHHHKHQGLDPLIRSVSKVKTALSNVSPVFQLFSFLVVCSTGSSKKMDGTWNRYNLKSTGRIYTFGVLKYSEKFKVLYLP